ncbi:hypothetical protein, partial [Rhodomicrobium vannielii]|uniref:hypothetical protein n=1 Tax=Rhodomicrobium vannielii TaxID=1069 RepID=UPI001AECE8B2
RRARVNFARRLGVKVRRRLTVAELFGLRDGVGQVEMRNGLANVSNIRRQIPFRKPPMNYALSPATSAPIPATSILAPMPPRTIAVCEARMCLVASECLPWRQGNGWSRRPGRQVSAVLRKLCLSDLART